MDGVTSYEAVRPLSHGARMFLKRLLGVRQRIELTNRPKPQSIPHASVRNPMHPKLLALAPIILLAACAEKPIDQMNYSEREELAQKLIKNCEAQGIDLYSPEMDVCYKIEVEREAKRRQSSVDRAENIGMAVSGRMKAYGEGIGRPGYTASYTPIPDPTPRRINCMSNSMGGFTNTTCY